MTRLISGKIKKTPSANADPNRYSWLDLQNAEPDLGVPASNGSLFVSSVDGTRSWSNTITLSGNVATINTLQVTGNTTVGNITATNLSFSGGALTLASNSNIKIGGGGPGQFLVSDGTNNLFWSSAAISVASGISNEQSSVAIVAPNGNITMSVAGTVGVVSVSNAGAVVTGNVNVTGNITSDTGVFTGNGSGLSAIAGANVTGTVANATTSVTAGTVTTNAQPNITSVGTLTGLSVNGNITAANITANTGIFTGNGSGLSAIAGANVTGTVSSATTATTAGTVTANTQPNITSIGTLTSLVVGGNANVTGNLVTGGTINSAGNITAPFVFANVIGNVSGNITVSGSNGEVLYNKEGNSGTSNAFSFNDASNVLTVTGNINANFFNGNGSGLSSITGANVTGAVAFATTANSVAGANVTGTVASATTATTAGSATTAGTVTTNAQPNITSVGTLTGLGVNGNITAANITANTGVFTGNGSGLSAIAGANVTGTVASATTAGTVTTNAQPNITSIGTLTSLGVNGNITAANITANTGVITGNGSGLSAIAGANVTGTVPSATTATTAGTVTTNAQPNITSVGTLTSLAVTGNVSGGNLTTGGAVSATGNVSGGNLTTTGVLSVAGTGVSSIAGNLDMTSNTIINLATPTNANDAATKQYVDDVAQGLHTHDSCNAATDTTLATISGGTVTYNNGTSGVGATLTTTGSYTTIDGVTLSNGMRILVKNEANTAHNGIYDRTSTTVLTRSSDFDTPTEMAGGDFTFVTAGTLYDNTGWVMTDPVTTVGTTPVLWVQFSGAGTYTAGTGLTLTGSQFSVNASQTQVTSVGTLTGLTVGNATANTVFGNGTINSTGNITALTFFGNLVGNISGNIVVPGSNTEVLYNNQGNAGASNAFTFNTASNVLTVTGNVSATNFIGNGAALTALNASNISTGTLAQARLANSNVILGSTTLALGTTTTTIAGLSSVTSTTFVGALSGNATTAGTVVTNAQPNITSVGTLTGLGVNGNITAANITANTGVFTGNGSGLSAIAGANVTGAVAFATTANAVAGANVSGTVSSATTAGTVTTNAQPNITSVGTLSSLAVTANANVGNLNATTAVVASTLTSNVATGTAPLTVTSTTRVSNLNVAQAGVADSINVAAGTGNNFLLFANAATGNVSELTSTGLTANLSNNSITAVTFVGALSGAATTAGTVTTNAQPNITSVGTLTGLTVGNATANTVFGNGTINSAGNITAPFVFANVVGNISGNFAVTGSNGEVIFNREGNAGSSNGFTFNNTSNALSVNGTITAPAFTANTGVFTGNGAGLTNIPGANVTGTVANATFATSAGTAGTVTTNAQPNITSVGTLTDLNVNGNAVIGGNLAINGNLTYLNVETVAVEDPIIQLQTGANGAAPVANSGKDVGTALNYFNTQARVAFMGWDVSNAEFGMASVATIAGEVVTFSTYGNLRVGNIIGNGQALTGLTGANVTGTVANATFATSAGSATTAGSATSAGTVTNNVQSNITSVGTLTELTVGNATANIIFGNGTINSTGNITAPYFLGNVVGNISGNIVVPGSNTEVLYNNQGNAGASNAFTFNSTSNALSVNGTVTAVNITANTGVFTGNGSALTALNASNISTGTLAQARLANSNVILGSTTLALGTTTTTIAGLSSVTSTTFVGSLTGAATSAASAGTVTNNAQPFITSVGTLTGLTVGNATANIIFGNGTVNATGNITAPFFLGNVQGNISGNFAVTGSNGEVIFNKEGNAGSSNGFTFNNTSNALTVTGNANVLNLGTARVIATGNISGTQLISNIATGTAPLVVTSTTRVANLNVANAAFADAATTAGTVTTNAQPNITSVGTLTGLTVGNATANTVFGNGTITAAGNITAPFFLGNVQGNISGNFAVTGSNTEVIFNKEGNAGSSNAFTFNNATNALSVSGTINASGNANVLNLGTARVIATGNISGTQLISNIATGTAPLVVTSTTQVANLNAATAGTAGSATTAGTVTTNAQGNITSVGTLTGLTVGNATANTIFGNGTINAAGNISAPFFFGNVQGNISGNFAVTGSNGEVIFNKEGNAGSSNGFSFNNTSNALTVTGNITGGNLVTGGIVSATGNVVTSANLVTNLIIGRTTGITITATGTNQNITLAPTGTGTVDVSGKILGNLATPSASTDAATKQYVDEVAQGLTIKSACRVATTGTLAVASGGTVTYNNGTSGVGATLTTTGSYTAIDGITLADGDRILVKNEAAPANNGIYVRTSATVLTRSTDFDNSPAGEVSGAFTFISSGTVNGDDGFVCTTDNPVVMGTTAITFTQFSGAGTFTAGTGLTLTGSVFSITDTTVTASSYGNGDRVASFTVNAQGQLTAAANTVITANAANLTGTTLNSSIVTSSLTTVGTLGSLAVTANITSGNANLGNAARANFFIGDGSQLTNLPIGTSLTNGTSSVAIPTINGNINLTAAGNTSLVVTGTGVNVAGTLNATGNANVLNLGTVRVIATGNISSGNANLGNLATANFFQGDGSLLTNIPIGTTLSNGTSSVNIPTAGGNINITRGGVANIVIITGTGVNVAGTLSTGTSNITSGNANLGNAAIANYFIGDGSQLTGVPGGQAIINGTSNVAIPTVNGNVNISVNSSSNRLVVTSSGANITGTLGVSGNANVGNLGTATAIITTGNITTINSGLMQNGTSNIVVAASGGNVTLGVAGTDRITATTTGANVTGTLGVSGNANVGNLGTATGIFTTAANTPLVQNGTSNVAITSGANVTLGVAGTARVTATSTGANVTGTLGVSGNINTSASVNVTDYVIRSVNNGLTATGNDQATALGIIREINLVNVVSAGSGVRLPTAVAGMVITIINNSANTLLVYPHSGGDINGAAINVAFSHSAGATLQYVIPNTTDWYTVGATFA